MNRLDLLRELQEVIGQAVPEDAPVKFFDGAESWPVNLLIARHRTGDSIYIESPACQDALRLRLDRERSRAAQSTDARLSRLETGLETLTLELRQQKPAALSEVSELPPDVRPTKEDCSACRSLLKEAEVSFRLCLADFGSRGCSAPLSYAVHETVARISQFLADPQQVKTDPDTARGESLLITLRDIRDETNKSNMSARDRLNRIACLVDDVLAKAEGPNA